MICADAVAGSREAINSAATLFRMYSKRPMRLAEPRAQTVDASTLAGQQIVGKPAVGQKIAVNFRGSNGVQPESGEVLQTKIQIAIDLSSREHRTQVRSPAGIGGQQFHGGVEADLGQGGHNSAVIGLIQTLLKSVDIHPAGILAPDQNQVVPVVFRTGVLRRVAPDSGVRKDT